MSIIYNGTTISKLIYNGTNVADAYYNGTKVFSSIIYVTKPSYSTITRNYNGSAQNNGYTTPTGVSMSGSNTGTNGGTYTATYTPQSGYAWTDGTTSSVSITMTIQYVWNKYNAVAYYSYNRTAFTVLRREETQIATSKSYVASGPEYPEDPVPTLFNSSTGLFTLGEVFYIGDSTSIRSLTPAMTTNESITPSSNEIICLDENAYYTDFYNNGILYPRMRDSSGYKYTSYLAGYNKGSTHYGTVTSTSNIYPENGRHSDGYWYVKAW